ncbi:4432_t:CDS:2, partial [Paraglomus occultum]
FVNDTYDSNQRPLYGNILINSQHELQAVARQQSQQYEPLYSSLQLPLSTGLPIYPISQQHELQAEARQQLQQYETLYRSLQLPLSVGLPIYPISQQQNDTLFTGQNLHTQSQQRGLSHYQNSRQHERQTPNALFMPMQSAHGLHPLPNTFGVTPGHYPSQLQGSIHHQVPPLQNNSGLMEIDEASLQSQ